MSVGDRIIWGDVYDTFFVSSFCVISTTICTNAYEILFGEFIHEFITTLQSERILELSDFQGNFINAIQFLE